MIQNIPAERDYLRLKGKVSYKVCVENEGRVSYKTCEKNQGGGEFWRYTFTCGRLIQHILAERHFLRYILRGGVSFKIREKN